MPLLCIINMLMVMITFACSPTALYRCQSPHEVPIPISSYLPPFLQYLPIISASPSMPPNQIIPNQMPRREGTAEGDIPLSTPPEKLELCFDHIIIKPTLCDFIEKSTYKGHGEYGHGLQRQHEAGAGRGAAPEGCLRAAAWGYFGQEVVSQEYGVRW